MLSQMFAFRFELIIPLLRFWGFLRGGKPPFPHHTVLARLNGKGSASSQGTRSARLLCPNHMENAPGPLRRARFCPRPRDPPSLGAAGTNPPPLASSPVARQSQGASPHRGAAAGTRGRGERDDLRYHHSHRTSVPQFPPSSIGSQRVSLPAWFSRGPGIPGGKMSSLDRALAFAHPRANALLQRSAVAERVWSERGKAGLEADEGCCEKRPKQQDLCGNYCVGRREAGGLPGWYHAPQAML